MNCGAPSSSARAAVTSSRPRESVAAQVPGEQIDCLVHAAELRGVVGLGRVEEAACGRGVAEPAPGQHRSGRQPQAEFTGKGVGFRKGVRRGLPGLDRLPMRGDAVVGRIAIAVLGHRPMLGTAADGTDIYEKGPRSPQSGRSGPTRL